MSVWSDIGYEIVDVVAVFGGVTTKRAQAYADRITGVRDKQWPITARVKGTTLYATSLDLDEEDQLTSRCTCAVGALCKHAAALAIRLVVAAKNGELDSSGAIGPTLPRLEGELGDWLEKLEPRSAPARARRTKEILYFLSEDDGQIVLEIRQATILRDGRFGKPRELRDIRKMIDPSRPDETRLVDRLLAFRKHGKNNYAAYAIDDYDARLIGDVIDTGRLFWQNSRTPIEHGAPRDELPVWIRVGNELRLEFRSGHRALNTADPLYLDPRLGLIGRLDLPLSPTERRLLATLPPVPRHLFRSVQRGLARHFGKPLEIMGTAVDIDREGVDELELEVEVILRLERGRGFGAPTIECDATARYGEQRFELCSFSPDDPAGRDVLAETQRRKELAALVQSVPLGYYDEPDSDRRMAISREVADTVIPRLRSSGWKAELGKGFTAQAPITDVEWTEELAELGAEMGESAGWFSYSLGVEVEGVTYSLLPFLVKALRNTKINLNLAELARGGGDGLTVEVASGKRVYIPRERLVKWLRPLLELELRGLTDDGQLRLAAPLALEMVKDDARRGIAGASIAMRLQERLEQLLTLEPRPEPAGFVGELRDYQRRGLSWLGFLHESAYGGILADDMGLGKTVQVLAMAQDLKNSGRLPKNEPILVVAPRSVAENWRREVARFTPELSAYVHLGTKRTRDADEIRGAADIVITSYQTLMRDADAFRAINWTSLILDEAQAVKNPKTKLRAALVSLRAVSRVCVTGTPIENRLLELWSQIDIAMPGLFGPRSGFIRVFETPIKHGDVRALDTLRRRLRPFMLRRTKSEVELALPAKTVSVVPIDLSGEQRDLYEGLRLALAKSVRDALSERGIGGSTMLVLDALLKLRQSCCDPRLVRVESARSVQESAKLERLLEMLDDLASNGRSVLVFSQFASMLALIEEACASRGIGTVKLTGKTRKRQEVIDAFQSGEVPVFLISLKAGGVGLNLTRADTVIHYDPWWNPAAEDQATDRAHRIGQTKPVFVYKLIASGTVEERVVDLQDQKRALTDAGLSKAGVSHLSASDLTALFD